MIKIYLLLLVVLFASCKPKVGSVSGNVFWKYNKYVGNKPDAGSSVELFSDKDTTLRFTAKADVAGNFKIENVPVGNYLLLVVSENTNDQSSNHLWRLIVSKPLLKKYLSYDLDSAPLLHKYQEFKDSVDAYRHQSIMNDNTDYVKFSRVLSKLEDKLDTLAYQVIESQPRYQRIFNAIPMKFDKKHYYDEVHVKEGIDERVVVDFGTTYY